MLIAVSLAFASCATTSLPAIGAGGKPFQMEEMEEDEKRVWQSAEELEWRLDKSGILYEDHKLEAYLGAVAQKLLAQNVQASDLTPRIKVLQHPLLNAFALPHGMIYLHTGLLARMENEAQLATVLGHELTHFTHRHTVREMRSVQNKVTFLQFLQVMLAGAVGTMLGELTGQVGAVWTLASVRGYSRDLETEADEEGLRAMVEAGYDPKEAPKVIEHFQRELDERRIKEPFFFGTHPRLQERIDNYRRLLDTQYAAQAKEGGRLRNSEEFQDSILPLLLDNAVLDLHLGRVQTARAAIEKHLQQHPKSARAYFLLGEVHRRSGQAELDNQRAVSAYQEAVRLDPTYAEPHRELGLLYRAKNERDRARAEFDQYLALSPQAVDAPIIRGYLAELGKP